MPIYHAKSANFQSANRSSVNPIWRQLCIFHNQREKKLQAHELSRIAYSTHILLEFLPLGIWPISIRGEVLFVTLTHFCFVKKI